MNQHSTWLQVSYFDPERREAPNYAEARAAESPADFVHKLAIVLKELKRVRVCGYR